MEFFARTSEINPKVREPYVEVRTDKWRKAKREAQLAAWAQDQENAEESWKPAYGRVEEVHCCLSVIRPNSREKGDQGQPE